VLRIYTPRGTRPRRIWLIFVPFDRYLYRSCPSWFSRSPPQKKLTFWALCFCHWSQLKQPILKKCCFGSRGKQTFAFRPRWPKNRPNRLLRGLFGHLGPPRGAPGARAQFFLGPVGAPRGRAAAQGGPLGAHFGPWSTTKMLKTIGKMCVCASEGSQEGTREKLQKLPDGSARSSKTEGSKMEWRGAPGPPRAPLGAPKRAAHHWPDRFWLRFGPPDPQNVWFFVGFIEVSKKQQKINTSLPGASDTRFSTEIGGPWGPQGPPWDFRVVFWGALGPPRGPLSETGGPGGGPGTPF